MPLLDHLRPSLNDESGWNSFHSNWATRLADQIAEALPEEFVVEEHTKSSGGVEIDVATTQTDAGPSANGIGTDRWHSAWQPGPPSGRIPGVFPDQFEVFVFQFSGGRHLVGAIELVSPGNKDRQDHRDAFTAKVVGYLQNGVSVIVIDVVTTRRANLHNELMRKVGAGDQLILPPEVSQYAAAYRPVVRDDRPDIDVWLASFGVGDCLPVLPLRLIGDFFVPVDFEAAYAEACRRRRLS